MFCIECGAQIPDGAKFCPSCGTPVDSKITEQVQGEVPKKPVKKTVNSKPKKEPKPEVDDDEEVIFRSKNEAIRKGQLPIALDWKSDDGYTCFIKFFSDEKNPLISYYHGTANTGLKCMYQFYKKDIVEQKMIKEKHMYNLTSIFFVVFGIIVTIGGFVSGMTYGIGIGIIMYILGCLFKTTTYHYDFTMKNSKVIKLDLSPSIIDNNPKIFQIINYIIGKTDSVTYTDFNNLNINYYTFVERYPELQNNLNKLGDDLKKFNDLPEY